MKKSNILLLDSGIGGLSLLKNLVKGGINANLFYFGDNGNVPYGNLSFLSLLKLTVQNINRTNIKPDAIVFACNTLSLTLRREIEKIYKTKVYGVFPNTEIQVANKEKTLVLLTERSFQMINAPKTGNITFFSPNNLALDIERNIFNTNKIDLDKHFTSLKGFNGNVQTLILGCTHYNLIENRLKSYFQPLFVKSGVDLTTDVLLKDFGGCKKCKTDSKNQVIFVGEYSKYNKDIFEKVVMNSLYQ